MYGCNAIFQPEGSFFNLLPVCSVFADGNGVSPNRLPGSFICVFHACNGFCSAKGNDCLSVLCPFLRFYCSLICSIQIIVNHNFCAADGSAAGLVELVFLTVYIPVYLFIRFGQGIYGNAPAGLIHASIMGNQDLISQDISLCRHHAPVNSSYLISNHPVIDSGNHVRKRILLCKSNNLALFLSVAALNPGDLIAEKLSAHGSSVFAAGFHGKCHTAWISCILLCCGCYLYRICDTASALCTVFSGLIIDIVNRSLFCIKLLCIFLCFCIRRHSPACEEFKHVLFSGRTGQTHKLIILISSVQSQLHITGSGSTAYIPCIRIDAGKDQVLSLLLIILIGLKVISVIIGQMELPVHSQLIAASALCSGGYLSVSVLILKAHRIIGILGLSQN